MREKLVWELNSLGEADRRRIWHGTFDKVGVVGVKHSVELRGGGEIEVTTAGDVNRLQSTCGLVECCGKRVVEKWVERDATNGEVQPGGSAGRHGGE